MGILGWGQHRKRLADGGVVFVHASAREEGGLESGAGGGWVELLSRRSRVLKKEEPKAAAVGSESFFT